MLSNSRSAAAYGCDSVTRTVCVVDLRDAKRLAADDEQVALRRADRLIQQHPEREHHIVGIEGMPVREAEALAQRQRVVASVRRALPLAWPARASVACVAGRCE